MRTLIAALLTVTTLSAQSQPLPPWQPKTDPVIRYVNQEVSKSYFEVKFDKGAVWACTIFVQITDGKNDAGEVQKPPYEPRLCGEIDANMDYYIEFWDPIPHYVHDADWDVYAHVGYFGPDGTQVVYRESKRVRVHQ